MNLKNIKEQPKIWDIVTIFWKHWKHEKKVWGTNRKWKLVLIDLPTTRAF